ncbi:ComEC/Rec2 family competence protein [Filomicrobium sp.]|uniref:ComEC/Rec2 family competence protein n=1 Tax=Filomicrobium sp. TaxID=2024831 RepID=UPI00258A3FEC|nr:ComEC/Rec2 family competence protein [Filomicrobium sp.]MCV0369376.1 ComEC family competence protein [Filomicrobium sp.]
MTLLRDEPSDVIAAPRRTGLLRAPFAWLSAQLEAERAAWFYWQPVAFGTGCALYFALPLEPAVWFFLAVSLAATVLIIMRPSATLLGSLIAFTGLAGLGLVVAKLRTEWVRAPVLQTQIGPVAVRGIVELIEPKAEGGERLTLRPLSVDKLTPNALPARIRVTTRNPTAGVSLGDQITLTANLSPPPRAALPGGYDFARYAWYRGIGAVGYSTSPPIVIEDGAPENLAQKLETWVARLRKHIGDRITAALPDERGAIATALITGERGGISDATNEIYRASGIYHILSISGLHMAIMGGSVFVALRFLFALFPSIALRFPIKKWAAVGAMFGAFGYLMISGGTFATVRAFLMITVMFSAMLLDRQAVALRNVAVAAFILLILFPESVIDPGFQMSFAAVIALVASYEAINQRFRAPSGPHRGVHMRFFYFFSGIVLSTIIASAAIAPFAIYHFHQNQHYAVLANLAVIPICNIVVMPAALTTLVLMPLGLETLPLIVMGYGIEAMTAAATWVAGLKGAVSLLPVVPNVAIALVAAGCLWLALMRYRWRLLGVLVIAAGIALAPTAERPALLVGGTGNLVLLRGADGFLNGLSSSRDEFELSRWLARDGDARRPADVTRAPALTCDGVGCVGAIDGKIVAITRHPAALRDDCRQAHILIVQGTRPRSCTQPQLIIDRSALEREGTHAVYLDKSGALRVETVEGARGRRPWTAAYQSTDEAAP